MRVFPKNQNNEFDISLSDKNGNVWDLRVLNGIKNMQEIPSSPSTMVISAGGQRYGDFEPNFSHMEQRDWGGGRAVDDFVSDNAGYYDAQAAWTLTGGKLFPAPQWKFAKGLRNTDENLPGDVTFYPLLGANRFIATSFAASASYNADKAYMWVRRRGHPGDLTFALYSDDSGPDAALQTVTVDTTDITDTISVFQVFDWTSTQALVSGTTYWVVISGASTDNSASHWEVGADESAYSSKKSSNGSTWADDAPKLYYRVVDADLARRFWFFDLEGATYAVSQYEDTTASKLYLNGDRGTATSGSTTTITNSGASFGTNNKYVGSWVKIIAGTGNGQKRKISGHSGTSITVSPAFKVAPDNSSRYVIYGTPYWKEITSTGLGKVVGRPCQAGRFVFFPQGSGVNIRTMRNDGTSHDFRDDGTNKADLMYMFYGDSVTKIYRAQNDLTDVTVSKASVPAWGANASYSSNVSCGSPDYLITNFKDFNGQVWIFKEDSIWLENGSTFTKLNLALGDNPSEKNGAAVATQDLVIYFSFLDSVEYTNGGNTTDFGPWLGAGIPSGRNGAISCLQPIMSWLCAGIDAEDGVSSVLVNDDIAGAVGGWHELFRGFEAGKRIRDLKYQPNFGTNNKLWIDIGGDIVYMDFPFNTLNPLNDSDFNYQHECVIISPTHDFGFTDLPKFFKELVGMTEKMVVGMEVAIDYQVDEYVGTDTWIYAGSWYRSPKATVVFNEGGCRKIRYRMRINTNDANNAPVVLATILKGFARTPIKRQWNLKIKADDSIKPNLKKFYKWLWSNSQEAGGVKMHTDLEETNNVWVIIEPPNVIREFKDTLTAMWGGYFILTLREA